MRSEPGFSAGLLESHREEIPANRLAEPLRVRQAVLAADGVSLLVIRHSANDRSGALAFASMRQNVSSGSPFEQTIGFSRAVRVGDRVWVSGTAPVWPDGHVDPDPGVQARRCLEIIATALAEAGAGVAHVVRTRQFIVDAADADAVGAAHGEVFGAVRPASTMVIVAGLLDPRWRVEIEAEALIRRAPRR